MATPTWTWSDFVAVAPDLSTTSPTTFAAMSQFAANQISASTFGSNYKLAGCYLTAHLIATSTSGQAGPITSESVGGVSVSYAPSGSRDLGRTGYGVAYHRLMRIAAGGGFVP